MFSGVRLEDYSALVLRPFLRGKVSRKRINQDFFESLCDVSIRQLSDIKAVLTNGVKSVYVKSDLLDEQLLHSLPKTVETLISGNSELHQEGFPAESILRFTKRWRATNWGRESCAGQKWATTLVLNRRSAEVE